MCHTISTFFNPAANDLVMEAAIKDIMDKLKRGAELLETGAIATTVLPVTIDPSSSRWERLRRLYFRSQSILRPAAEASAGRVNASQVA